MLYLIVMFPSINFEDLYSNMQSIEACPLQCNFSNPESILTWTVWHIAQQYETSLLFFDRGENIYFLIKSAHHHVDPSAILVCTIFTLNMVYTKYGTP